MTQRQSQLLKFVTAFITDNEYSPSYAEMMVALGLKSKSGIHRMVHDLARRGFIRVTPGCRAIELVSRAA